MTDPAGDSARSLSPAVTRAAAILEVLASSGGPLGLSEIARQVGMPKSTAANICGALADSGLLRRRSGGFGLGERLAALGAAYLDGVDEVALFHEVRDEVPSVAGETTQLATMGAGMDVTYLARADGRFPVRLASAPGRGLPASCTATGKAMLAMLGAEELQRRLDAAGRLPRLTPNSITSRTALLDDLKRIRTRGYALDREEVVEGVVCVGVAMPLTGKVDRPLAVSCTLPAARATPELIEELSKGLGLLVERLDRLRDGGRP